MSDEDSRLRLSYVLWGAGLAAALFALLLIVLWHQHDWPLVVATAGGVVALIGRRMRGRSALGFVEKLGKPGK